MTQEVKSDYTLIEEFTAGSEASFEELINRYSTKVYNLAFRYLKNQQDAEEVLQDVFSTVYRKVHKFEGKSAFSSWIYRVTVNAAFMKLRKKRRNKSIFIDDVHQHIRNTWVCERSESENAIELTYRNEIRDLLEQNIDRLPDEYKGVFILRDVNGLTNREVGDTLGLTIPAVKSRLHRARTMLKRKLKGMFSEPISPEDLQISSAG